MSLPHTGSSASADAFILAGGRSSRMGRDKALVPLAGKPLIRHAVEIARNAGLEPRIAGARSDLSYFAPTLVDEHPDSGQGPLAGICTALASGTQDFAVFLPVDLPLLPPGLIAYLLRHAEFTESAVALASVSAFVETFPVVIWREALPTLRASLHSGDRNCLRALRDASGVLSRPFSALPVELLLQSGHLSHRRGFPPARWFFNVNSPQDVTRAEALFTRRQLQVS